MKRTWKNVIMIGCVVLLVLGLCFTGYYIKEHNGNGNIENKEMMPPNGNGNGAPEKPEGSGDSNEVPEKPEGNGDNGVPEKPEGDMGSGTKSLSAIYYVIIGLDSILLASLIVYLGMSKFNERSFKEVFINKDKIIIGGLSVLLLTGVLTLGSVKIVEKFALNNINMTKEPFNNGGNISYSASEKIDKDTDIDEGSYTSDTKDENAILVSGEVDANISNIEVSKTGDSDGGDSTSFYGTNSAILAKDKTNLTLSNINVTTNATGANGVFSYGGSATTNNSSSDGTTVTISDSKIVTKKDNSGGIMTTGGGVMNAYNLDIETSGISSAAIRSDRGGGKVTVKGGTYKTKGQGSPAIYSTADISVSDATLTSFASEGIVIEGKNSVSIDNVVLTDTNNKLNAQSTTYKNIFLYQSMSGDAADGDATFTTANSKIVTNKGDSFYVTNTSAIINLTNNSIVNNDNSGAFLRVQSDSWGTKGSNGGDVTLNLTKQDVEGNIVIDSISTLVINMKNNSSFTGVINSDNEAKSIVLNLDATSKIKLEGDCYISELNNKDSSNSNIDFNGYKLYVNGKEVK